MSEPLKKYWADRLYETEEALIEQQPFLVLPQKGVYLAADVDRVFKPMLEDYCATIQTLLNVTSEELPSKPAARERLTEATRLLERLR